MFASVIASYLYEDLQMVTMSCGYEKLLWKSKSHIL